MPDQRGISLSVAIVVVLFIGSLVAVLATLSHMGPSGALVAQGGMQARYAALSGISTARALGTADLEAIHAASGSQRAYTAGPTRFILTVGPASAGAYPVTSLGTVGAGTNAEANAMVSATVTPVVTSQQSTTTSALTSGEDIGLEQGVYVHGDVSAASDIALKNLVAVEGNVSSAQGSITLEQGASITGTACAGGEGVTLKTGSIVNGNVYAHGDVDLEQGAWVFGSISTTGTVTLKLGSAVYGDIYSTYGAAGVSYQGGVLWGHAYSLTTDITCATSTVPNPTVTTGTYAALTLESGQSRTLSPGTHTYSTVTLKMGSTLYLDLSSKRPITIYTTGDVNLENGANVLIKTATSGGYKTSLALYLAGDIQSAALVYLKSEGNVTLKLNESWYGTIFARKSLDFEQGVGLIGAYASPGPVTVKTAVGLLEYVLANAAW